MKVLLSIPNMPTISFKADDEFKKNLDWLAKHNGINVSAYIKLNLMKIIKKDMNEITVNGNNKSSVINDKNMFDINKTYTDEIMHFIESIKRDVEPAITLEDGLKVLRLLEDKNV